MSIPKGYKRRSRVRLRRSISEDYVILPKGRCPCGRPIREVEEDGSPMFWDIYGESDWTKTRFVAVCGACATKVLVDCGIRRPRRRPRKVAISA